MKKLAIMAVLALGTLCAFAVVNIDSVVSRDTGVDKNRVVINVSGDARYSVQSSSGGVVHRIVIPDAGSISGKPDYKRLSPVIDRISAYREGANAVIEIRTMDAVDVSHSLQDGKIVLNLGKAGTTPVVNQQPAVPKPGHTLPAEPRPTTRYYDSPQEIATINVKPTRKPTPKPLPPDTLRAENAAPAVEKQLFPATSEIDSVAPPQAVAGDMPEKAETGVAFGELVSRYRIWGFGALTLIILFFMIRAALKKPAAKDELKGTTLVLDEETKTRMVMKLVKEGWKASQIARELNISQREVEHVISLAQMSGGLDDHH